MKPELDSLGADLRAEIAEVKAGQRLLKWMVVCNIAMTLAALFLLLKEHV